MAFGLDWGPVLHALRDQAEATDTLAAAIDRLAAATDRCAAAQEYANKLSTIMIKTIDGSVVEP